MCLKCRAKCGGGAALYALAVPSTCGGLHWWAWRRAMTHVITVWWVTYYWFFAHNNWLNLQKKKSVYMLKIGFEVVLIKIGRDQHTLCWQSHPSNPIQSKHFFLLTCLWICCTCDEGIWKAMPSVPPSCRRPVLQTAGWPSSMDEWPPSAPLCSSSGSRTDSADTHTPL